MSLLVAVIWFLIYVLVIGLVFYLVIWVLGLLRIPVPQQAVRIVGAIIFLLVLLWFVVTVMGSGTLPHMQLR